MSVAVAADVGADEAWRDGPLAGLPPSTVALLLEDARVLELAAGESLYRNGADPVQLMLIADGMMRMCITRDDGRRLTMRYADRGALVGLSAVLSTPTDHRQERTWSEISGARRSCDALRDTVVLVLRTERFLRLLRTDHQVADAMLRYLARLVDEGQRWLGSDVLLSVRERLARHLLSLAERVDGEFAVRATNQELADSVGSVRDVVSRVLGDLQADGLVKRRGRRLVLLAPASLHRLAVGRPVVSGP